MDLEGHEIFNLATGVEEAARKWGDRAALYHYESGERVTFAELNRMSSRVGNGLLSLGVETEDRVAILMEDCPEWAYIFFGTLKLGSVIVLLNTLLAEKDNAFYLKDSRAKVLFVGENLLEKVEGAIPSLPHLKHVVVCKGNNVGEERGMTKWETFIKNASGELQIEPTLSSDVALFAYTSGSTGRPRAIMHSHNNVRIGATPFEEVYGVGEGDVQFHVPKLYFLTTIGGLNSIFSNGSSVVLLSGRPTPATIFDVIARYRPTFLQGWWIWPGRWPVRRTAARSNPGRKSRLCG